MNTDLITDAQLEQEAYRPPYKFAGKELWPWSRGARTCWRLLCDDERDIGIIQVLAMMWVLTKRTESTAAADLKKNVIPVIYGDRNEARANIIFWRDELTEADESEAIRIHNEILQLESQSRIHVSSESGQKKMPAIPPQTPAMPLTSSVADTTGQPTT